MENLPFICSVEIILVQLLDTLAKVIGDTAPGFWRVCDRNLRRATAISILSFERSAQLDIVDINGSLTEELADDCNGVGTVSGELLRFVEVLRGEAVGKDDPFTEKC